MHNPSDAKVAVKTRASKVKSSARVAAVSGQLWSAWIAEGLRGQAVRAVHVVLDGAFDENRPLLTMHPDPEKPASRAGSAFVTGDEVLALADAVGADVLSFGSPPKNPTDVATRMIADGVGQEACGDHVVLRAVNGPRRQGARRSPRRHQESDRVVAAQSIPVRLCAARTRRKRQRARATDVRSDERLECGRLREPRREPGAERYPRRNLSRLGIGAVVGRLSRPIPRQPGRGSGSAV